MGGYKVTSNQEQKIMKKLSKAVKRALKAGAIPPVRGGIKHYKPKPRAVPPTWVGPAIESGVRKDGTW